MVGAFDRTDGDAIRTRLLEQFLAVQEDERRRLARDLHDEIGQSLTSVLIGLRTAADAADAAAVRDRLEGLRETVNGALHEVRRPRTAWEHFAVGRILLRRGDTAAAAVELRQAFDAEPQGLWPNFYYGLAAYRLGRVQEAVAAFSACTPSPRTWPGVSSTGRKPTPAWDATTWPWPTWTGPCGSTHS